MMSSVAAWLALVVASVEPGGAVAKGEDVLLSGKVVVLAAALKASGVACDAEPISKQVVLLDREGTIVPLLSDDASRALFLDERLRDRPVKIAARRFRGSPYMQVITFKVEDHGRMRTPEYFCEICSISVRSPQICPCCQGPMVLRMKSEAR